MLELIENGDLQALVAYIEIRAVIILICWAFMLGGCMIDFWSGTTTAKAIGEKLMSHGFRRTVTKICDYARLMLFGLMFDALGSLFTAYKMPFLTMLCAAATLGIEFKSVWENSRRKKSHAAEVPDMVKRIVQAATTKQAEQVIALLGDNHKTE